MQNILRSALGFMSLSLVVASSTSAHADDELSFAQYTAQMDMIFPMARAQLTTALDGVAAINGSRITPAQQAGAKYGSAAVRNALVAKATKALNATPPDPVAARAAITELFDYNNRTWALACGYDPTPAVQREVARWWLPRNQANRMAQAANMNSFGYRFWDQAVQATDAIIARP